MDCPCWIALEALDKVVRFVEPKKVTALQPSGFPFCGFCDLPYFVKHVQLTANLKDILERVSKSISIPFLL